MAGYLRFPRTDAAWPAWFFLAVTGSALAAPTALWLVLAAAAALGIAFLAWRNLEGFSVAWLLLIGLSLEMTLNDLLCPQSYAATIAVVKGLQFGLAALCMLRYGARLDPFNPAWVYFAIFAFGVGHGLHPGLSVADSLRSLAGSVAPFVFCFSRLSPDWSRAIIRAARWIPLISVAGGVILDSAGMRPLFVDSGGMRLAGLGHPAFLAGVCLTSIYACLIRLYREGQRGDLVLLGVNFLILVLTGARAPLAYATLVTAASLAFVASPAMPARRRWLLLLAAATALPVLLAVGGALFDIRLFNLLATDNGINLSGRELLWPAFERAAAGSVWFGWGLGAGNFIVPSDSAVAQALQTWAAHNEYLRMEVEGGQVGRTWLIAAFVVWVLRRTAPLPRAERRIMRLIFVAFAAHAATDNVLISTPASVLFSFVAAVFAGTPGARVAPRSSLPEAAALA